jgi:hypothetical protein
MQHVDVDGNWIMQDLEQPDEVPILADAVWDNAHVPMRIPMQYTCDTAPPPAYDNDSSRRPNDESLAKAPSAPAAIP